VRVCCDSALAFGFGLTLQLSARLPSGMRVARVSEIVGAMMRRGTTVLVICADEVADDAGLFASAAIASATIIDKQTKASLACIGVDPVLMRG
jgi:hypothetical protein